MKYIPVFLFLFFFSFQAYSQKIPAENLKQLKSTEFAIKGYSDNIINSEEWFDRFKADSFFTRGLVQALKVPYSFYYNFDSLKISKLYAPDSSFKIFTWQVMKDFSYYRQRGAIQMKTADGSLKLFPLFDCSDFTTRPTDSLRDAKHWIGAIYYKIILKSFNNKKYYTLLGADGNNERTDKKWIEILTFDANNNPQFGSRVFQYPADDAKPKQPVFRFCLEYKKDGGARLNYDAKYDAIIFDHLTSQTNSPDDKTTLIPYGDYEGFKWVNGQWVYINNPFSNVIFDTKQTDLPSTILDSKGNRNEKKLEEISNKNQQKKIDSIPPPNKINDKQKPYKPGERVDY
jgi:hypothetical protein